MTPMDDWDRVNTYSEAVTAILNALTNIGTLNYENVQHFVFHDCGDEALVKSIMVSMIAENLIAATFRDRYEIISNGKIWLVNHQ